MPGELRERDRVALAGPVVAGKGDEEALLRQVATLELLGLAPLGGSVLKRERQVQVAGRNPGAGLLGADLLDRYRDIVVARAEPLGGKLLRARVWKRLSATADSSLCATIPAMSAICRRFMAPRSRRQRAARYLQAGDRPFERGTAHLSESPLRRAF